MCGISGVFYRGQGDDNEVRSCVVRMNEFQNSRGPDAEGVFIDSNICLGHRRLSIIDLSKRGIQPMTRGDVTISFNGEIYNFLELKRSLKEKGVNFNTNTDTEVILALFEKYGADSFSRLRGMFAFAIWDEKKKELFLVRDRFGIKPLYYSTDGEKIVFASTVGAIEKSGFVEKNKNEDAFLGFLLFGSVPLPLTTNKKIHAIPDGSYLQASEKEEVIKRYYSSLEFFLNTKQKNNYKEEVKRILKESVNLHLISDAPLGVFLSGGLDSSAIAALASENRKSSLTTLSVNFEEAEFSEKKYQDIVSKKIKSNHKEILVRKQDFFDDFQNALSAMDQPTIDGINTYFISRVAHKAGLKVVLSGLGSDEIFLGYRNFKRAKLLRNIGKIPFSGLISKFSSGKYKKLEFLGVSEILGFYLAFRGLFTPKEVAELLGVTKEYVYEFIRNLEVRLFGDDLAILRKMNVVQLLSYLEVKLYMQNQLLKDTDFMSMAHSVEVRVPFLDHVLLECVAQISPKEKLKGHENKGVLVNAVRDILPAEIFERKKMGFTFPFDKWMRELPGVDSLSSREWQKVWGREVLKFFQGK